MKRKLFMMLLMTMVTLTTWAQSAINGTVVSARDGEPIIGATVKVKGASQGTVSDVNGKFTINAQAGEKLVVSYIGMQAVEATAKNNMRVELTEDEATLDEVIVVAYGTQKKSSFTGSASSVNSKSLEKRAITNVTSAIEGNVSGVQVTSATGQPGESASLRIRGFGSVNASNAPLYVVDGAIYNGALADINPTDIESMTILKDAASCALYGSSAGNGVVLITTKKGQKDGKTGVTLTINQGWSNHAYKDYATMGINDFYQTEWTMLKNANISAGKTAEEAASIASAGLISKLGGYNIYSGVADDQVVMTNGTINPSANTLKWGDDLDLYDAAFKTGYRQEYIIGYNTKTAKSDTYASVGYLKDNGYMIKTDFERYTGRLNYNVNPVKWLKTGLNIGVTRTNSNYSTSTASSSSSYSNLARYVRSTGPIYPLHKHDLATGAYLDANGNATTDPSQYVYDYDGTRVSNAGRDAIAETMFNSREITRTTENGTTYLTIMPIDGLSLTANYSLNNVDRRRKVYENPWVGDGTAGPARLNILSTRTLTQTFNQLINYKKTFNRHSIDALIGHENYSYKYEYMYAMKTGETLNGIYDFENFVNISSLSSFTDNYKKEGYLARVNYDYDNKYYASLSYRHDGSSRFSKDNRWGNFWSFGASWRISEEEFMKNISWIDNLKIRASYGETGNDAILNSDGDDDLYAYQTLYGLGYTNGTEAGAFFTTIANSNLKWETQVSTDVALEFGLFDRLTGSIEYFNKESKDLLFDVSQPLSSGVSSIVQNIGKVRNSGVEIDLNYQVLKNSPVTLSVGANATFLKNKLITLPDEMKENGYISGSKKWMEGKSMYEFWLRQWAGVDPKTGNGLYLFDEEQYGENETALGTVVEYNGQKCTNSYSYAKYDWSGRSIPTMYGGFNFRVGYKNFDLSAVFSYQLGGKMLDLNYASLMETDEYGVALSPDLLKAWKQEGDITDVPRVDATAAHNTNIAQSYSTRWLTSTDYLNLRTVSLGYTFPKALISKLSIANARINLTAENLFMIKARQGLNPSAQFNGIAYNEYQPARTITIGINVGF